MSPKLPKIVFRLLVICMAGFTFSAFAIEPTLDNPDPNNLIEWTRKIYANDGWNGSPDIAYWQGHYYIAINQGDMHAGENHPSIVLRSADLEQWEQVHNTDGPSVDCKLFPYGDRLFFYYVYMRRPGDPLVPQEPDVRNYVETRAVNTDDGTEWSESQKVYEPLHNFWRPKLCDDWIYVASDYFDVGRTDYVTREEETTSRLCRIDLLRSSDGLEWEKVSTILKGNHHFNITETSLAFLPDGELFAFTRQNFISRSPPPYTTWTNQTAKMASGGIAGPSLIAFGDDIYVSGRYYGYLKDHGTKDSPQTNKFATSLWKYNHQTEELDRIADFPRPAFADLGYTGFVSTGDGVFMVYYSGHEYGETAEARATKADIFLSKVRIGG